METIRLTGRNSRLSLLQLGKVKRLIEDRFPAITVEIVARSSRGDALQDVPLHTVEGSDFFTKDIFDALHRGEADIAVHSLKDMSSEHFFGNHLFVVPDRDDPRDVAIFHTSAEDKIRKGEPLTIGTCSPRREEMATGFLRQALPCYGTPAVVVTHSIRGNVDTRLRKLDNGEYDGIILATAGINRLLRSEQDASVVRSLLEGKRFMLLPLVECVPAPCQGAIVAEALPSNKKAAAILAAIDEPYLSKTCRLEKQTAMQYGTGCIQRFGVAVIKYGNKEVVYAAGRDNKDRPFSRWTGLPELQIPNGPVFSTTDYMGDFFGYRYMDTTPVFTEPVLYIANYKAVKQETVISQLKQKRVWAAGTRTWLELAKKGIWVEGSADAFGLEFLQPVWQMPLVNVQQNDMAVITSQSSATIWQAKGWNTYYTYDLSARYNETIAEKIKQAALIFWTSYHQYLVYGKDAAAGAVHACPYGETAGQLRAAGIQPVVFPTIKAFQQWKQTFIPSRSVA